jgi:ribosomal protein L23
MPTPANSPQSNTAEQGGGTIPGIKNAEKVRKVVEERPSGRKVKVEPPASNDGEKLPPQLKNAFEQLFDTSLNKVRIHVGEEAAKKAEELGAKSFTSGANIYFASGAYSPKSAKGQVLIAQELCHAIQQNFKPKAFVQVTKKIMN